MDEEIESCTSEEEGKWKYANVRPFLLVLFDFVSSRGTDSTPPVVAPGSLVLLLRRRRLHLVDRE